jgi:hypothetical protein
MTNEAFRYTRVDRTFDSLALFLGGLIGWVCDRLPAKRIGHSTHKECSQHRRFHESSR